MTDNKKKTMSIEEFKAWLDGVEEMGGKGWSPNAAQWKKIRSKLKTIQNVSQNVPSTPSGYPRANVPLLPPAPRDPIPNDMIDREPPPLDSSDLRADRPMSSDVKATITTPSIDTSSGEYNSTFE